MRTRRLIKVAVAVIVVGMVAGLQPVWGREQLAPAR